MSRFSNPSATSELREVLAVDLQTAVTQITTPFIRLKQDIHSIPYTDTDIHRAITEFEPKVFRCLVMDAFPLTRALNQDEALIGWNAKTTLSKHLRCFDRVLKRIEAYGLCTYNVRPRITWLLGRSDEATFESWGVTDQPRPLYTFPASVHPVPESSSKYIGPDEFAYDDHRTLVPASASRPRPGPSSIKKLREAENIRNSYAAHQKDWKSTRSRTLPKAVQIDNAQSYDQNWDPTRATSVTSENTCEPINRHIQNTSYEHRSLYSYASGSRTSTSTQW